MQFVVPMLRNVGLALVVLAPGTLAVIPLRGGKSLQMTVDNAALAASRMGRLGGTMKNSGAKESCGPLSTFPHAEPKNYADARKIKYDAGAEATVEVTFLAGDKIEFKCIPGYTTDGTKGGSPTFEVECSEMGYYKPSGVCLKASKCGAVPSISHAFPTGKTTGDRVQFQCSTGYSLDGDKVVEGGSENNRFFELSCIEFSGEYEKFTGQCKPHALVASTETTRIYSQVFEALFTVSCKGTLKRAFGTDGAPPKGLEAACSKLQDSSLQGRCQSLVAQVKADFDAKKAAREAHDKSSEKEWFDVKDKERPGISDEAHTFCQELWKLLETKS